MTRDAIAWVTRESVGPRSTIAWEPIYPPPPEKPRRVCAKKGCRRLVPPAANGRRIYCTPEHSPWQPKKPARRVCAREGCRRWWVPKYGDPTARNRKYCTPVHRMLVAEQKARRHQNIRSRARNEKSLRALSYDRVGDRLDHAKWLKCERCLERPARKRYTFCLPCSVCRECGDGKPMVGQRACRACNEKTKRYNRQPEVRARAAAKKRTPEFRAKRRASRDGSRDYQYVRAKRLAVSKQLRRDRAKADTRICQRDDCGALLAGARIDAKWCSPRCASIAAKRRRRAAKRAAALR